MRKITAHKSIDDFGYAGPFPWAPPPKHKIVFHEISFVEDVRTPDGIMKLVKITSVTDLNNPNIDIALLIPGDNGLDAGKLDRSPVACSRTILAAGTELWYWNDKFWLKAVDGLGVDYYQKKCYALYEVEISNRVELLASLA